MNLPRRNFLHLAASAAALPAASRLAWAQTYPTRPVRIVVPFGAGVSPDIIARLVGQALSERLGQQGIIEKRAGAGGEKRTRGGGWAPPRGDTPLTAAGAKATTRPRLQRHYF